jgi:hypothetical protein
MKKCQICNTKSEFLEKHHIIPKSRGGSDSKNNLIELCSNCHGKAHNIEFKNERGGLVKEGAKRTKDQVEKDKEWLENNDFLVLKKLNKLMDANQEKHDLFLNLMHCNKIDATHLKKWVINGSFRLKTNITFN